MSKLVAGVVFLAFMTPHIHHQHRPGCNKLFTVKMGQRAARAVYAGTRNVTRGEIQMLRRIERCQRNPRARWFVQWFDRHHERLWWVRRHTPYWAIPWPVVQCESGGRNLPPNGAGASGYYQIIPSTWTAYGGYGSAAYLAPKPEQDSVAGRIWREAGPSQWVCAGMTGY